jgi:hypothetical protein
MKQVLKKRKAAAGLLKIDSTILSTPCQKYERIEDYFYPFLRGPSADLNYRSLGITLLSPLFT